MTDQEHATYAVVVDGLCVNLIVWDGKTDYNPGEEATLVKLLEGEQSGIGWTYNPKATKNKWVDNRPPEEATDASD